MQPSAASKTAWQPSARPLLLHAHPAQAPSWARMHTIQVWQLHLVAAGAEGGQSDAEAHPQLLGGLLRGAGQRSIRLAQPVHYVVGGLPVRCSLPDLDPIHVHHHLHA